MQSTELARGKITRTDSITVELREPNGNPPLILIHWPDQATICTPEQLSATAAKIAHLMASATVQLARIKRDRRL